MNRKIAGLALALVAAVGLVVLTSQHVRPVEAQVGGSYSIYGQTYAVGNFVGVANAVDSILYDGELVMVDTTTAASSNIKRIAVKRFDGTALGRLRVIGIVAGNIPKSSLRGTGKVLTWGFHPRAYVGLSNLAANSAIKIGLLNAMFQGADTLEAGCGYAISRSSASTSTVNTGPRYQYKVYFWGNRVAGATL